MMAVFMSSLAAPAQITFSFTYTDAPGTGFNSSGQLGVDRKAALAQTGVLLSDLFPTYTATIIILVDGTETNDVIPATAASAFTSTEAVACTAGYNRGDIGIKILGGVDPSPGLADGSISVNFEDFVWDLDDVVDPAQLDFKSILAPPAFARRRLRQFGDRGRCRSLWEHGTNGRRMESI